MTYATEFSPCSQKLPAMLQWFSWNKWHVLAVALGAYIFRTKDISEAIFLSDII